MRPALRHIGNALAVMIIMVMLIGPFVGYAWLHRIDLSVRDDLIWTGWSHGTWTSVVLAFTFVWYLVWKIGFGTMLLILAFETENEIPSRIEMGVLYVLWFVPLLPSVFHGMTYTALNATAVLGGGIWALVSLHRPYERFRRQLAQTGAATFP